MLITIHDSKASATIDTLGAQLISYQDSAGKEYIWQRDPEVWPRCSPLLFPTVGNCRNGKTCIGGTWYEMEKHGFCQGSDFEALAKSDSEASFRLEANEMTRRSYPYEFTLTLTYRLENGVLHMLYQVENRQDTSMHYCIGAHPGFICPMEEGAAFDDYLLELEQDEHTHSMVYDLKNHQFDAESSKIVLDGTKIIPLDYELFADDAVYFDQLRSRSVSIIHKDSRKGVQVDFPGFETVAFWTNYDKKAPYVCVEPWNGSAIRSDEDDNFENRHHLQTLQGGETRCHGLAIRILQ